MGKKKYAKSPLLYIHQPNIRTPEAPMQHNYVTPKKSGEQQVQEQPKKTQKRPLKRSSSVKNNENKDNVEEIESTDEEEEAESSEQDRKKFKDMTLRERVNYFMNRPKHVPIMKCEVKTEERNYRGVIVDFQEETVFMRVGRRTSQTKIPFDSISEIRMIGF
ncbi:CotO family spore coat protein [Virgibacillus doumboii]|uniref:CotO family spore coat protein n=1 Tax=Virgibacillus doumboii TaxID=2697503 RepID=UPI0013DF851E|nr:CotO family spore coat protein [Virgibacillus doumboii]